MRINNITFLEYCKLEDKSAFDFVIKFSKEFELAIDHFGVGDITLKKFGTVKELQHKYEKGIEYKDYFELIEDMTGKKENEIMSIRLMEFFQAIRYLNTEIERVNTLETKMLSHEPTDLEIRAGIEKFNVLGNFNQKTFFCDKFNWTLEYVDNMKYTDAFAFLYKDKLMTDFQKKYTKLSTK